MKKITKEEVVKGLSEMGLALDLNEVYVDCFTKMKCYSKEGYKYLVNYNDNIKHKSHPRPFYKGNPFTIENIKLWLELNEPDYELLSEVYKGTKFKLLFRYKPLDLPVFKMSWADFYSIGRRHPHFSKQKEKESVDRRRKKPSDVRKEIETILSNSCWTLAPSEENKYKNSQQRLLFYNNEGYKSAISLLGLQSGRTPMYFHKKLAETSTFNMYKWTKENTEYSMKEGQLYKGNDVNYVFICDSHGEFVKTWSSMLQKTQCCACFRESVSGENSNFWNPFLTNKERIASKERYRDFPEYNIWRKQVFERDGYICQACGGKGDGLQAHHLDGYHWCVERRFDLSNGITLCRDCHSCFHNTYGYSNNKEKQFIEWITEINTVKKKEIVF